MAYDFNTATIATRPRGEVVGEMVALRNNLEAVARQMERKWGKARLQALVPDELCQRFYRQLAKVRAAAAENDDQASIVETRKMIGAWHYLDREAERLGAEPLHPMVWETALSDGTVIAIVHDHDDEFAMLADQQGREMRVYTIGEIARLIEANPVELAIKEKFPGAKIVEPFLSSLDPMFWERGDEIPF